MNMFFNTLTSPVYSTLWNKYRPAIIQMMIASEEGPQQYKLFVHEFKALKPKEKSFSFEVTAHKGKVVASSKQSETAADLLNVLNFSRKASELMEEHKFEFVLDKHFMLHIKRLITVPENLVDIQ